GTGSPACPPRTNPSHERRGPRSARPFPNSRDAGRGGGRRAGRLASLRLSRHESDRAANSRVRLARRRSQDDPPVVLLDPREGRAPEAGPPARAARAGSSAGSRPGLSDLAGAGAGPRGDDRGGAQDRPRVFGAGASALRVARGRGHGGASAGVGGGDPLLGGSG